MPSTRLRGKPEIFQASAGHDVQRVADDDQDGVGGVRGDLFADRADDLGVLREQVVARHARLARQAGGDDDHVAEPAVSA